MHLTLDDIVREIFLVYPETIMPLYKRKALLAVFVINQSARDTYRQG
jgi:uncharacterized membrane protein YobD (UPF0266 family)